MSEHSIVIVLIVMLIVLLAWAEHYRREANGLRDELAAMQLLLDYRKK